ncbi:DUF2079 domain-containing protein [Streptomyces catenulae]|uniref:DUF2079 domain-containing protein n=1 Tax=Streptomyces catenulae TaxID=66875 RepID=A0ABV2Z309_9ACTN|nr:DUF2079 domain-containing protein [Streptomyces catenulae]
MDTAAATAAGAGPATPGTATGAPPGQRTAPPDIPREAPAAARGGRFAAWRAPRLDPWWLAALLFAAYATLSLLRHLTMGTASWDLGIFEQAVRGYAHLGAPIVDLKGPGTNILGDHFSPVLILLAPLYRLLPSPLTLLTAQAALFALSSVPVTRAAARYLGRARGLAVGVAYGLSWGLQKAVDFDFHEIAFALPLLAFALEAVVRGRWTAAVCWAAPLVLVKEDLGVTAAAIGVVVLVRARQALPLAVALVGFGLAATAVTLGVIIPGFNGTGSYDYWSKLGGDGAAGPAIGVGEALHTLLWVLLPTTGLLALRSPLLLAAVPTLGWRFVSHEPHYWGIDWHYNAVLMPVVFLALVDALERTGRSPRPRLRALADQLPAAVLAAALALTTTLPLSRLTESATYRIPPEVAAAERLLATVPDGASVEADIRPLSRLVSRTRVFWIGDTRGIAPDYVAVQLSDGRTPEQVRTEAEQRHPHTRYAVSGTAAELLVLRRTSGP